MVLSLFLTPHTFIAMGYKPKQKLKLSLLEDRGEYDWDLGTGKYFSEHKKS